MTNRSTQALVLAPLLITIIFAKVSFPPFSTLGLGIGLPLILCITFAGIVLQYFQINFQRFFLFLLLAIWSCGTQLFGKVFSFSSLLLLVFLYFPYTLQLKPIRSYSESENYWSSNVLTDLGFIFSILGCAQYALQFLAGPALAFPLEHYLPSGILIQRFNYLNVLYYGSSIYKSNGFFFVEPSFFSQFLAISLLIELTRKTRILRIMLHVLALCCTFSGTGLIVLAAGLITLILIYKRWDLIGFLCLVALLTLFLSETLRLNIFIDRAAEFSSVGSSAFERFVSWTYMLQDQFWTFSSRVWTGMGAGTFEGQQRIARYSVAETPFSKVVFEFGLPGAVFYFLFTGYCIFSGSVSTVVKIGLFVCTLMNVAYSEFNAGLLLTLGLWPNSVTAKNEIHHEGSLSIFTQPVKNNEKI